VRLRGVTLATLFQRNLVDPRIYQALKLDTQGSELLVLRGALLYLIWLQVHKDIKAFMAEHGYQEMFLRRFARRAQGGSYFDVVYSRDY